MSELKKKILIVEDNPRNRRLERDLLELAGYEVFEAENGKEGILQAEEHLPDLILMDVQLPGMDGTEVVKILREYEQTKNIQCVFVTAYATEKEVERIKSKTGCLGYITKPIDTRTFVKEIDEFINT